MRPRIFFTAIAALALLTSAVDAAAQTPPAAAASDAAHFTISRFEVKGNTLLSAAEIDKQVAPYTGEGKDFGDIQRALQAIETAYRKKGYGAVHVALPEQDITSGVVELTIVEPKLNTVTIEGNKHFSTANVRASLPSLKEGALPSSQRIARNLQMLEENPAKRTSVLLKANDDGDVDATVKVDDDSPMRYFASIDNTGTSATGKVRTGVGFQQANLFNHDEVLTAQFITSPGHTSDVTVAGASYHMPIYNRNTSIDILGGYANVNSGVLQNLFNVSGSGTIFGARLNYYLPKYGDYSHKISLGQDYRAYKNNVNVSGGTSVVPDISIQPTSLTYNGLWRLKDSEFSFYGSYVQNFFHGNNDGSNADFDASRKGARASYQLWRAGFNYIERLRHDWQIRAAFNSQFTRNALVSGEQFGFGGINSVRGFDEREVANDRGFVVNLEAYTPDFGGRFVRWMNWDGVSARGLVFYDQGYVRRNKIQPGETGGDSGSSLGAGLRFSFKKNFSLRADLARVMNPAGVEKSGDSRIQFSGVFVY